MKKSLAAFEVGVSVLMALSACQSTEMYSTDSEYTVASGEIPPWLLDGEDSEQILAGPTTHNRNDMMNLSKYLIERYSKYDTIRVYCVPLYDFENNRPINEKAMLYDDIINIEKMLGEYNLTRDFLPTKTFKIV